MKNNFKRRGRERRQKTTYLIVCEGHCEKYYFESVKRSERLTNISVEILNPRVSSPKSLCSYAKKEIKRKEYDRVFCVFDCDVLGGKNLPHECISKTIQPIVSRPCFELWLLLHFKYTNKKFCNCKELVSGELRKHIPDYDKTQNYHKKKKFYIGLKDKLEIALSNAEKLEQANSNNQIECGTLTHIHKIVKEIINNKK